MCSLEIFDFINPTSHSPTTLSINTTLRGWVASDIQSAIGLADLPTRSGLAAGFNKTSPKLSQVFLGGGERVTIHKG